MAQGTGAGDYRKRYPGLSIDSGPLTATCQLHSVEPDRWLDLMRLRRDYMKRQIGYDCRCLVEFVDDAEKMHRHLGFASTDDMVRRGYELVPEMVGWAITGLQRLRPGEPTSLAAAVRLGKREIGIEGGKPGPGRGHKTADDISRLSGYGTSAAYILARLDRDGHTELAARVRAGTTSANAAAKQAGWRRDKTPLEKALAPLPLFTDEELAELEREIAQLRRQRFGSVPSSARIEG